MAFGSGPTGPPPGPPGGPPPSYYGGRGPPPMYAGPPPGRGFSTPNYFGRGPPPGRGTPDPFGSYPMAPKPPSKYSNTIGFNQGPPPTPPPYYGSRPYSPGQSPFSNLSTPVLKK
jgi:RNA polymerase II-associated factor 1